MKTPPTTVITGTRTGIGLRLAEHYLARGHHVVGCSRGEVDAIDSELLRDHDRYEHYALDVADEAAVVRLFRDVQRRHGSIDHLINNAGVASMNHFALTPMTTVKKILDTNVSGAFLFSREAIKGMIKSGHGRIVNIGSVLTRLRVPGEAIYTASKAALESLGRSLALEVGAKGITVNTLGVGPTETDMIRGVPAETMERLLAQQPLGRLTRFDEIAHVVDFFIHPSSSGVSGQTVYLGGA